MSQQQMQMFQHLTPNIPQYESALQSKPVGSEQQVLTQPPISPAQVAFPIHGELNAATMAS